MQGVNRHAFVGTEVGATVGCMAISAVGRRSGLEGAGPVRRRIREFMTTIYYSAGSDMAARATDSRAIVGEADGVVDLEAVIAVLGGEVVIGDVAGLVGMADIALVGRVMVGRNLAAGVTAGGRLVAGNDAGGETGGEGAVTVAAFGTVTIFGGDTPFAFPNPFVSMATDEGAVRATGRSCAAELVDRHREVGLGTAQGAGLVGARRGGGVTGNAGSR